MMMKASEATGNRRLIGLADASYCSGAQLKSCEAKGIEVYVPIPKQAARRARAGDSTAMISVTTRRMTRMSVRPDSGWFDAAQALTRASYISIITRRQRFAETVRCRTDVCQSRNQPAECSAGSMRM